MLNLFKYNFCIRNQIELANNIAYSNYLLCTVRSYCLQSVWFHTWVGCSVSLFSCSSSVFRWDFGGSLNIVLTSWSAALRPGSWRRMKLSWSGVTGAWDLPLRLLGQGKMVSLPAGGVCWGRVCVTKLRSCRKRSSDCAASETTKGNGWNLLRDPAATGS